MLAIRRLFGWLTSKAILYVALVVAILAGAVVVPWVKAQWHDPARQLALAQQFERQVVGPLNVERDATQARLTKVGSEARAKSLNELTAAIVKAEGSKTAAIKARRGARDKAISLATGKTDALVADGKRELEIQYLTAEIAGLSTARDRIKRGNILAALPAGVEAARAQADQARAACRATRLTYERSEARWQVRATFRLYDQDARRALKARMDQACGKSQAADRQQRDAQQRRDLAVRAYQASQAWTETTIQPVTTDVEAWIARTRVSANGSWGQKARLFAERIRVPAALQQAGYALVAIIISPFLIRLFCYFVLAPAAMRRPAVRLLATEEAEVAIPPAERSATSVGVRLAAGEELLVRSGYLQTTSDAGGKGTQWLLDSRHPITSLVTGLTFLTRIRGEGEITTVSAVRDPFAEVTVLTLPEGSACVLQPRALAAVVQPIGRRLRVTGHWRLLSLNAWLTMQLRYLVFHGPARLVLKGGRGVRVERAERGRILGQDQVVGFSTDLAYSVTRNETFWPYFLGREPLLRDRVAAGNGVLIVEEAPMAGRRPDEVPQGIEGLIDAGMKVFGW
jgi:hypothetical protein